MQRRDMLGSVIGLAPLLYGAGAMAQTVSSKLKSEFAPTGRLRVAINYGNAVLAQHDPATGKLSGVSVDIAKELGHRLGLPLTLVPFDEAGKVTAVATSNVWDVAFLARDPLRAREITFTAAYLIIDGSYLVHTSSPITRTDQVDQEGVKIYVAKGSAYDLFLSRVIKHAQLIRAGDTPEAIALFKSDNLGVLAGVKQAVQQVVATDSGLRLLSQPYMEIDQAMGVPAGRPLAAAYLRNFVENLKASGEIAKVLARNGQANAIIAPAG